MTSTISFPRYTTRLVGHFFNSDDLAVPRYDVIDTATGEVMLASETLVFAHNEAEALNRAVSQIPAKVRVRDGWGNEDVMDESLFREHYESFGWHIVGAA